MVYMESGLGRAPRHRAAALSSEARKISKAQIGGSDGYKTQWRAEILEAWKFLKDKNTSLPTIIIDFMRDSALAALEEKDGEIYIVEGEIGEYEDRQRYIVFAGGNKQKAFDAAIGQSVTYPQGTHTIFIALYRNGVMISQLHHESGDRWEWNFGKDKMEYPPSWDPK